MLLRRDHVVWSGRWLENVSFANLAHGLQDDLDGAVVAVFVAAELQGEHRVSPWRDILANPLAVAKALQRAADQESSQLGQAHIAQVELTTAARTGERDLVSVGEEDFDEALALTDANDFLATNEPVGVFDRAVDISIDAEKWESVIFTVGRLAVHLAHEIYQ